MTVYTLPLSGSPKLVSVALPSGAYKFRTVYASAPNGEGGWLLDIATGDGVALACGLPIVIGADLLEQYAYLGLGAKLYCINTDNPGEPPSFSNLGTTANLYLEV